MASGIYNRFKVNLLNKEIDLEVDDIKVMLLNNVHSFNAAHINKSQIEANEINGTGYTAGGVVLVNKVVTEGAVSNFDADDPEWTEATFGAWHAVLYRVTESDLICSIDFGGEKAVELGTFYIRWNDDGIITLT